MKNRVFLELKENLQNGLWSISELVNRLEALKSDSAEKIQCTTAMRDNIDMMQNQLDEMTNFYGKISGYKKEKKGYDWETFVMKETRVLVADDNEMNNHMVAQMLRNFNVEVDTVTSGEEAIKLFKRKEYDMILMDYLMPPGMDGVETIRQIRNLGTKGEQQLIIGLTANTVEEFKEGLNQYNVELILYKPLKYQQMAVIFQNELPQKIVSA